MNIKRIYESTAMDNGDVFQENLTLTKKYYYTANDTIWSDPTVIDIIKNNPLRPREALIGKTINEYKFKYRGIPIQINQCLQQ